MAEKLDMSPRGQFMRQLSPKLPSKWRLIKFERNVDEIDRVTVLVRQRAVRRFAAAPLGFYETQFVLELIVPQTDMELAEDALDEALFEFLAILDSINPTLWESTNKVLDATTKRLAYDVTTNFQTKKE